MRSWSFCLKNVHFNPSWKHECELRTPLQGIFSQRAHRSLREYILCVTAINANGVTEKANSVPRLY